MARDKITVELELQARRAQREVDKIQKSVDAIGKSLGKSFGTGSKVGTDKVRALGTGLSKATVRADEFSKSMEASNARVIAFGASAGLIMGVDRAMRAMVASAIKVEKAMMDVNIVMDLNTKQLEKFGRGMFKVAKETAQSFETVAEAGTELARQGLGMEQTLVRTKDALILTRLTGMNAADAVKSLTAAVNSFNKEGVTSAEVINRMAKVDQKFAVSSEDLAKSISRVGASAVSAGVSMNELMAITTAVQQRTARGGAVIGNAFKTIFTRIQRSDVKTRLRDLGVAITDNNGKMLSGMKVLQNLANEFDNLSRAQKSQISENVAGVFQVNILKAALADLSQETSNYKGALNAASSATDEAYQKNQKLNTTLDTLVNKTLVNLTQAGATIGGATLGPAIDKILNTVNSTVEAFGKGGKFESFGEGLGKDLLAGIGRFISGPGLVLATAVFAKLALSLGKFATQAFKDIIGINDATKQRQALEQAVVNTIKKEPALLEKVEKGTLDIKKLEQDILNTLKLQSAERSKMQAYAAPVAKALAKRGAVTGPKGVTIGGKPGGAGGFVPSFAAAGERAAAAAGGYTAGSIRTMNQPGAGSIMYNSAETVKRFPGMAQSAIMPPQGSAAGAGYKDAFGSAHGFDPYAGRGFVPSFARKAAKRNDPFTLRASFPVGVLLGSGPVPATTDNYSQLLFGGKKNRSGKGSVAKIAKLPQMNEVFRMYQAGEIDNPRLQLKDIATRGVFPLKSDVVRAAGEASSFENEFTQLEKGLGDFAGTIQREIFGNTDRGKEAIQGVTSFLGSSVQGEIFEASVRAALKQNPEQLEGAGKLAPFDFNPYETADKDLLNLFGGKFTDLERIEAKIKREAAHNIVSKYVNEFMEAGKHSDQVDPNIMSLVDSITRRYGTTTGGKKKKRAALATRKAAMGFVPNFSPLTDAVGREMTAGIPPSAIRVGSNPALTSSGNRGGLGVYNTIDEPRGLSQGISRSRSQGINPKTHGAGAGFVPNFVPPLAAALPALFAWLKTNIVGVLTAGYIATKTFGKKTATNTAKTAKELSKKGVESVKGKYGSVKSSWRDNKEGRAEMFEKHGQMAMLAAWMVGDKIAGSGPGGQAALTTGMGTVGGYAVGKGKGAIIGGLMAAATQWSDIMEALGFATEETTSLLAEEAKVQKSLGAVALEAAVSMGDLVKELDAVSLIKLKDDWDKIHGGSPEMKFMRTTPEYARMQATTTGAGYQESMGEFALRAKRRRAVMGLMERPSVGVMGQVTFGKGMKSKLMGQYGVADPAIQGQLDALGGAPQFTGMTERESPGPQLIRTKDVEKWKKEHKRITGQKTLMGAGPEAGRAVGRGLLPLLGETDQFSVRDRMLKLAQDPSMMNRPFRDDPRHLQAEMFTRAEELRGMPVADALAGATGMDRADAASLGHFVARTLDPEQLEAFKESIIQAYTNVDEFVRAESELTRIEKDRADQAKALRDGNLELARSVTLLNVGFLKAGQAADLAYKLEAKKNKQELSIFKLGQQSTKIQKGTYLTRHAMIGEAEDEAIKLAGKTKTTSLKTLRAQATRSAIKAQTAAGGKAGDEFIKLMREGKIAPGTDKETGGISRLEGMKGANATLARIIKEFKDAETTEGKGKVIDRYLDEKDVLTAAASKSGAELSREQGYTLAALTTVMPELLNIMGKTVEGMALIEATELDTLETAKEVKKVALERYEAEIEINEAAKAEARQKKALIAIQETRETQVRFRKGQIGYGGVMSARRSELEARRAAAGMTEAQIEAKFGASGASLLKGKNLNSVDIAAENIALTLKELDEDFTGANNNIVDTTRIFTDALRDAASDLVSFADASGAATARERAEGHYKKGLITSDQLRGRRAADRFARRRRGDARSGDMMEAFRDQFLYNGQDHMDQFEEGVIGVAQTMKSSFADAFKSLTSGASSGKEALKAFADSILNSISDISARMATNMLFSGLGGNAQGGYIPRFQGGGVVAGGSGFKDDVPALMSGGEYVIKKSSAQKIGYGTLNAINSGGSRGGSIPHYAEGGSTAGSGEFSGTNMAAMYAVSAAASMASGYLNRPDKTAKQTSRNYGLGRDEYGYFGGADPDAGGSDAIRGGGRRASVSLNKAFVYYRRDPVTGQLISERARPTEGRFETSSLLSTRAMLREDDPQTARIFSKEGKMADYQQTRADWKKNKEDTLKAHYKAQNARTIGAWMNAAMIIGVGAYTDPGAFSGGGGGGGGGGWTNPLGQPTTPLPGARGGSIPKFGGGGKVSPAMLMGGEYVMSPEAVRTHGVNFMSELNRGNVPGGAGGGFFMGGGGGAMSGSAPTTNNVKININIDKSGKAEVGASTEPFADGGQDERDTNNEAQDNKNMAELLQGVVLSEIAKQQRPGGLLQNARP